MIDNVLEQARATLETYKNAGGEKPATVEAMYDALAVTLRPSDYDNNTRLGCANSTNKCNGIVGLR